MEINKDTSKSLILKALPLNTRALAITTKTS